MAFRIYFPEFMAKDSSHFIKLHRSTLQSSCCPLAYAHDDNADTDKYNGDDDASKVGNTLLQFSIHCS